MPLEWGKLAIKAEILLSCYVSSAGYFEGLRIFHILERNTIILILIFSSLSHLLLRLPISPRQFSIEPIFFHILRYLFKLFLARLYLDGFLEVVLRLNKEFIVARTASHRIFFQGFNPQLKTLFQFYRGWLIDQSRDSSY